MSAKQNGQSGPTSFVLTVSWDSANARPKVSGPEPLDVGDKPNVKIQWEFDPDDGGLTWFMIANLYEEGSEEFARMLPKDVVYKGDNPQHCFTIDKNKDAPSGGYKDHKYWVVGSNQATVGVLDPTIRNRGS